MSAAKNPPRKGPGGSLVYARKPSGRARGVPQSDAERRASISNAQPKPGGLTKADRRLARKAARFDIPAVVKAYSDAIESGDLTGIEAIAVRGLADLEGIRRGIVEDVRRRGPVFEEAIVSPLGDVVGTKVRVHPGVDTVVRVSEQLGFSSEARRLDPKSRGEGARDDAVAAMLKRDQFLRGYSRTLGAAALPPPPEDETIDAETVKREPEG